MSLKLPSDKLLFRIAIQQLQVNIRTLPRDGREVRRNRLFAELASLSKRFIAERQTFEELLTIEGLQEVSAAIYALEWERLYYSLEAQRLARLKHGYFQRLWWALCNKETLPL